MLDYVLLAKETVAFLAPFLPHLINVGEKVAEEAGKKLGEQAGGGAWETAKALWSRLRPKVETKPASHEAVHEVVSNPKDEDALAALRLQLKKLFAEDESLASEVFKIQKEAQKAGVNVAAIGEGSVAVGGNVNSSVINTGNRNKISN
ncbi:MAG: hypothetical protein QOH70_2555 [Blastocatellia bacterium]|jgi:hypothetical protein|nr:hypothetical protein [Blastocatellia bacterium]